MQWSDGESNPDLLNAIQPSSPVTAERKPALPPSNVCKTAGHGNELQTVIELWDTLPEATRQAILAMVAKAAKSE